MSKSRFQVLAEDLDALESAAKAGDLDEASKRQAAAHLLLEAAEINHILAERADASASLIPYCEYIDPLYESAEHLQLIGDYLSQVERYIETGGAEGIGRLVISMPPRHGKSHTITNRWPSFLLGRHPDWRLALVSYAATLAEDGSKTNREIIRSEPKYHLLFPNVQLADGSSAIDRWSLSGKNSGIPSVVAVGVGGPLVGRGFHVVVIDDPIKGRTEAESKTVRENLKSWYRGTLRTRLEPGGAIVIVMTRWHEDDLVGWLLSRKDEGATEWTVLNLPALAETFDQKGNSIDDPLGRQEGQALWPERYDRPILLDTKADVGSYDWASQFQGHPKPPQGSKILREWFKIIPVEQVPANLRWVRYYDLAISSKKGSSYTASIRGAYDKDGQLYLVGMLHGRWEWPQQQKIIKTTIQAEHDLGVIHGIESALHGTAAVQALRTDKTLRKNIIRPIDVHADKLTRALPWIALAEAGVVHLVEGAWIPGFLDEAASFTGHNDLYDDQVDAVSGVVAMLSKFKLTVKTGKNPFYK